MKSTDYSVILKCQPPYNSRLGFQSSSTYEIPKYHIQRKHCCESSRIIFGTLFPIWNQSTVSCPVLTVASWPAYRFLRRQVRWSGIPISWRIFHSLFSFQSQRKAMLKNIQTTTQLHSSHTLAKQCWKICVNMALS